MNQRLIIEAMFKVLSDRITIFVALFLNFTLFAYAVWQPDYIRLAVAGLFSITVFIPVLKTSNTGTNQQEREAA